MSSKNKKSKHKTKLSDDLPETNDKKKKISFKEETDNNNNNNNSNSDNEDSHKKNNDFSRKSRRKHTKVSHKSKENNLNNIVNSEKEKGKKVRFSKIDVIDVECWKKLNLKMTAEENLDELLKLTEGKKEKVKNVNCCIIL